MPKKLSAYTKRRDFRRTPEPKGGVGSGSVRPRFVIQQHDARHMHYDVRLQIGDVLVSWAVPKGPSTDPAKRRLAVRTEDHPMAYASFEGRIPEGAYGAGTVIIWDRGTFRDLKKDRRSLEQSLKKGEIEVFLHGKKLKGGYAMVRIAKKGGKEQWLMIKMDDRYASARRNPISTQKKSVKSGKTLAAVRKETKKKA